MSIRVKISGSMVIPERMIQAKSKELGISRKESLEELRKFVMGLEEVQGLDNLTVDIEEVE